MQIAILSDIHDHIENLAKVLEQISERKCEQVICCGDICAPFTAKILAGTGLPTFSVFGNNDGDQGSIILQTSDKIKFFTIGQEHGEVELDGKKIAFCHYPEHGRMLAESGKYAAVFYGHNHIQKTETVKESLLCNPGPICGIVAGKTDTASWAIYNTDNNQVETIIL